MYGILTINNNTRQEVGLSHVHFWKSVTIRDISQLGSVHTALAIALGLAMPKSGSLAKSLAKICLFPVFF